MALLITVLYDCPKIDDKKMMIRRCNASAVVHISEWIHDITNKKWQKKHINI